MWVAQESWLKMDQRASMSSRRTLWCALEELEQKEEMEEGTPTTGVGKALLIGLQACPSSIRGCQAFDTLQGANNFVRDNVGANSNGFGMSFFALSGGRTPLFKGADFSLVNESYTFDTRTTPILEFNNNELYASTNGMTIWNIGAQCCLDVLNTTESVVRNYKSWHISRLPFTLEAIVEFYIDLQQIGRYGHYGYGQNKITYDGWVQRCLLFHSWTWAIYNPLQVTSQFWSTHTSSILDFGLEITSPETWCFVMATFKAVECAFRFPSNLVT